MGDPQHLNYLGQNWNETRNSLFAQEIVGVPTFSFISIKFIKGPKLTKQGFWQTGSRKIGFKLRQKFVKVFRYVKINV